CARWNHGSFNLW
nr:immunoglobulin heavy chain junction region [Macaca mulatta]